MTSRRLTRLTVAALPLLLLAVGCKHQSPAEVSKGPPDSSALISVK